MGESGGAARRRGLLLSRRMSGGEAGRPGEGPGGLGAGREAQIDEAFATRSVRVSCSRGAARGVVAVGWGGEGKSVGKFQFLQSVF